MTDSQLCAISQFSRYDFLIYSVRNSYLPLCPNQPQVANIINIIHGNLLGLLTTCQYRLDDTPYTFFFQFVCQLINMCISPQNDVLFGFPDHIHCNRSGSITPILHIKTGFIAKSVHQPWLPLCQVPDQIQRFVFKHLAGFLCMLIIKGKYLFSGKITQPQGFGLDIKGASTSNNRLFLC